MTAPASAADVARLPRRVRAPASGCVSRCVKPWPRRVQTVCPSHKRHTVGLGGRSIRCLQPCGRMEPPSPTIHMGQGSAPRESSVSIAHRSLFDRMTCGTGSGAGAGPRRQLAPRQGAFGSEAPCDAASRAMGASLAAGFPAKCTYSPQPARAADVCESNARLAAERHNAVRTAAHTMPLICSARREVVISRVTSLCTALARRRLMTDYPDSKSPAKPGQASPLTAAA